MTKKYYCEKCNFYTNDKYNFQRHKQTSKHKSKRFSCEYCGKQYKFRSGLCRHLMKCEPVEIEHLNENIEENKLIHYNEKKNNTQDNSNSTEVKELLEIIKTQQKQLNQSHKLIDKVIKETVPRIGNNNNNISINVYLNEKCKNAMNLTDFVDKINVSLEDLVYTQQHGYIQGITNIFTKQLKDLSPNERPIHCCDKKRLQFYVKDDNTWMKDNKHMKLDKSLNEVKIKQMKKLKQWEDLHPDYLLNEDLLNKWQIMVKEIIGPFESKKDQEKNLSIIKKQIATNTIIPDKYCLKDK